MFHGVAECGWDEIDEGWTIWCTCGFNTEPSALMEYTGMQFDDHLREMGVLKE